MKGDFTRWTHSPAKGYSAVLLQQGRVLLDADWNEQREIDLAARRALARDLIGAAAGPAGASGFAVEARDEDGDGVREALYLEAGRYYVDGVLCELHEDTPVAAQPDLPGVDPTAELASGRYAVYLDVWEHHVTHIEDPDIKEKALGGVDHTTRKRLVSQARLVPLDGIEGDECDILHDPLALAELVEGPRGRLAASVDPAPATTDPCIVPPSAGYRGLENQLYRVEIHRAGNDGSVTFKWSRDNGSVVTAWTAQPDPGGEPESIEVADLGPDDDRGFRTPNLLVELLDDALELDSTPGLLARIASVDAASRTIVLADPVGAAGNSVALTEISRSDTALHPRIRRWDCAALRRIDAVDDDDGTHQWIELERGVRVRFEFGGGRTFRTGDYWLIPARTVDGTIAWAPDDLQLPHGISHRFACLAIVVRAADGSWTVERSCQSHFPAADSLIHMRYVGGDGQQGVLGHSLPAPLEVQVVNGALPVESAQVRFTIVEPPSSDGLLLDPITGATGQNLVVETNSDGTAQVRFTLASESAWSSAPSLIDQRVRATLLDACDDATDQHVVFSAHESQAREVRYDESVCPPMAQLHGAGHETDHVQRALDVLCSNPHLDHVGGDGQAAMPGEELPGDLVVRVGNGAFPMAGVMVRFTLVDLTDASSATSEAWAGSLGPLPVGAVVEATWPSGHAREVRIPTDAEGRASLRWRMGATPGSQRPGVLARIVLPAPFDATFGPGAVIRFGAQWSQANDVWYEPNCARLEAAGVTTVQDALDALCVQLDTVGAGCGELTIGPSDDPQAVFDSIPDFGDARVCVHPATFILSNTLVIRDKGNLVVTGAGPGTRFVGPELECALRFENCESVSLRDLEIEATSPPPDPRQPGDGLQGALSLLDCGEVDLQRVRAIDPALGELRRASAIQVRVVEDARAGCRVRIHDCHAEVGHGQTGILVVDAARVEIERNRVVCPRTEWDLRGRVQTDQVSAAWAGRQLIGRIRFVPEDRFLSDIFLGSSVVALNDEDLGQVGLEPDPGRITLVAGLGQWEGDRDNVLVFTVPPALGDPRPWELLLENNPMAGYDPAMTHSDVWVEAELRRLRRRLARAAFGEPDLVQVPAEMLPALTQWALELEQANAVTAGGQGIVVGGRRTPRVGTSRRSWNSVHTNTSDPHTPDVRIIGNTVDGFVQGIHVGTSHNEHDPTKSRRLRAHRVRIADNTITLRVPSLARERHGIFVGNTQSVQVCNNLVELLYPTDEPTLEPRSELQALDGIRLWGTYGPMVHVLGNHTTGVTVGIRVRALNPHVGHYPSGSWLVRDNAYVGLGSAEELVMS